MTKKNENNTAASASNTVTSNNKKGTTKEASTKNAGVETEVAATSSKAGGNQTTPAFIAPDLNPEIGAPKEGAFWKRWDDERIDLGQTGRLEFEGSRGKIKKASAMTAIEIVQRADHDWDAEADQFGLDVPESKHPWMAAVVVTFGDNTSEDAKTKQDLAKFRDRQALAIQWLVEEINDEPHNFPASEKGIRAAVELIEENGGITAVAQLQRNSNEKSKAAKDGKKSKGAVSHPAIRLDSQRVRDVRLSRARDTLQEKTGDRELHLGFVYGSGDDQKIALTISPDDRQLEEALLLVDTVDQLVDQMGELLQAGSMVAEEPADVLRDNLDDPEDPESGYRQGFRHVVFTENEPVVISPILNPAGVVVIAKPLNPLLPGNLDRPCHLRTRERRIMEANIAEPDRRGVYSASWGDVGNTQGLFRFEASTDAAGEGEKNTVSVLVEPLRSHAGNLPLNAHLDRFKPLFEGEISLRTWRARNSEFVAKAIKPKKGGKVEHTLKSGTWKVAANKKDDERDLTGKGSAILAVVDADFVAVSKTIADLPIQGDIKVQADRNTGMVLSFSTRLFDYQVVVPARMPDGGRNGALFSPFAVPEA